MKLLTTIPPRANGTVIARVPGNNTPYLFAGDDLSCDVEHDADAKYLLGLGQFVPACEADFSKASSLLDKPVRQAEEDPGYEIKTVDLDDDEAGDAASPSADFDIQTADAKALRDFIKAKTGSAPPGATGLDRLRAIAETVAD